MRWRWEMTPAELFAGFKFIKAGKVRLRLETNPFRADVPSAPLPETELRFQLALGTKSVSAEVVGVRAALVWSGDRIIGSLVIDGLRYNGGYEMFVVPEYRQLHIGYRMLLEWCDATVRPLPEVPRQGITLPSTKALLAVHRSIVDRALAAGKPVPLHVQTAIASGVEAAQILERAERAEAYVLGPR
jgi:hypothetical protein